MTNEVHGAQKGRWKCSKQVKFDDYLGKHGIGFVQRKLVNKVPCTVEIIENEDGSWTVNEITAVRTATTNYSLDVRHTGLHPVSLKPVFGLVTVEDGKVATKGFAGEDSDEVIEWATRELLEDGTMQQIIYFGDLVCKRWFVKEA